MKRHKPLDPQMTQMSTDEMKISSTSLNKLLLPLGEGGDEGMKNKLLIHLLRAPSEQKTAWVARQRVSFFDAKKGTKETGAGFQRSLHVHVIECPRQSLFLAAALTWHPCPGIARFAIHANLPGNNSFLGASNSAGAPSWREGVEAFLFADMTPRYDLPRIQEFQQ